MATGDKHKVVLYQTVASKLSDLAVVNGQIILTTDTKTIYYDINGLRLPYNIIQTYATEADRSSVLAPIEGYYYVQDTNVLWNYQNGAWHQLTPNNLNPIVLLDSTDDFPEAGSEMSVYVTHNATYRWIASTKTYEVVSNKTAWEGL